MGRGGHRYGVGDRLPRARQGGRGDGLLYVLIPVDIRRVWMMAGQDSPAGMTTRTTLGSWFYSSFFSGILLHDVRQALPPYAIHGLRINDEEDTDRPADTLAKAPSRWPVVAAMGLAMVVAFLVPAPACSGPNTRSRRR